MFLKALQPSSLHTYPSANVSYDTSVNARASTLSNSLGGMAKADCSTVSIKNIDRDGKTQMDTAPITSDNLARPSQRKTTQRKKCVTKEDNLVQMTLEERVHPIAKLLIIISLQLLRKGEVKSHDSPSQKTTFEAILDQINISEKEYDALADGTPFDIPPSPAKEVVDTFERIKGQQDNLLATPVTTVQVSSPLKKPKSSTFQRTRSRCRPTYLFRQKCLHDDHPLSFSASHTDDTGMHLALNQTESKPQQHEIVKSHFRTEINPIPRLRPSLRSLKSMVNSISSYINLSHSVPNSTPKPIRSPEPKLICVEPCLPLDIESVPTPLLRWYLNPIVHAPIEAHVSPLQRKRRQRGCLVSIQMQTYKISISKIEPLGSIISLRTKSKSTDNCSSDDYEPRVRRRDMRENGEFLRIAVMEMLMRKRGKLDEQRPGKARIVLPPRTLSIRPPEMTADGIPLRWVSHTV